MTKEQKTDKRSIIPRRTHYDTSIIRYSYFVTRHLRQFLFYAVDACVRAGNEVCDMGCGEQPLRTRVEALGGIYTGIDVTQNAANSVDIIAPCTDVPLPDSRFDVILCTEVLEHVSDTPKSFQELARLLKTDGFLIVTTPFMYPLHEEPYDYVRLTPYQIRKYAGCYGFRVLELATSGNEIEVIATVWDTMWRQSVNGNDVLSTAWVALMRLSMNLLAGFGSKILGRIQPRKCYLSTLTILQRS